MCGIAGFIDPRGQLSDPRTTLEAMASSLSHRGPDDSGVWWDEHLRVGFSHRRLSIIDLTSAGHQPMVSASGRFTIVFNGEIYNAGELRGELDARVRIAWRGRSDTEMMLEAIDAWGVAEAARKFNGMFAFAVWDKQAQTLHLVRDPMGKKPLYYGWIGRVFAFASELKGIAPVSSGALDVDRSALAAYLRLGHVPGSQCIHPNLRKLPAGQIASMQVRAECGTQPTIATFWSANDRAQACEAHLLVETDSALIDQLQTHLHSAVSRRMISDVPLGAFLSGGVDSALVVALMSRASSSRIKTFTIGFDNAAYDESARARATARALGTDHTEVVATARDAMAIIPRLCNIYDEPFADSSQIPTVMLSELTRSKVTVALSGDGADELLGGYDRYLVAPRMFAKLRFQPMFIRRFMANCLSMVAGRSGSRLHEKLDRVASIIALSDFESVYRALSSSGEGAEILVIGAGGEQESHLKRWHGDAQSIASKMMHRDFVSYLVDDLLVKVDRASMSVGLEVRSPYLDREFVEWSWRVPMSAKIRGGRGKWISYQLANRLVPGGFPNQPKLGFGVPIAAWLRTDLRDWAEDLLDERRLARDGFFHPKETRARWEAFLAGREIDRHLIWAVLMFQSWNAARSNRLPN